MTNSPFTTIALILLMVVAFYFLILRPQKKRQQAQQKTMNELVPGTRVLLGSGVFGTITWVGVKQAIIEVTPGVELTVLKQAIARVVAPGDEYSEPLDVVDEPDEVDEPTAVEAPAGGADEPRSDPTRPAGVVEDGVDRDRKRDSEPTSTKE
jgi:preprotein translocase subunit YajC